MTLAGSSNRPDDEIAVRIDSAQWADALDDPVALCCTAARMAIAAAPPPTIVELSILLADDDRLRQLNHTYRGLDRPTNVLSFGGEPMPVELANGVPHLLGDVAIAAQTTDREARAAGKTLAAHLSHLVVHGTLHLLGHDHDNDTDATTMEALERRILARLGIADPYATPPDLL
ncbi:MAG: rRNA maturation RNase YbeY [Alphaproteobacteria bacterium]